MPIAVISVFDKTKLDYLGEVLNEINFDIYATTGTLRYLRDKKIRAFPVEDIARNPTGFDDYITSLSFNTLIGTLIKEKPNVRNVDIEKIDLVVYNFVRTWEIIESLDDFNINHVDLGGPTMIRAAAINYKNSIPIVSPSQYIVLSNYPKITMKTRIELAKEALDYCSWYDNELSKFLRYIYKA